MVDCTNFSRTPIRGWRPSLFIVLTLIIPSFSVIASDGQVVEAQEGYVVERKQSRGNVEKSGSGLKLSQARHQALDAHPRLRAAKRQLEANRGLVFQAGRRLNPELHFEVENLGGNGTIEGLGAIQNSLGIAQTIRTAGKRDKLIQAANIQEILSRWDLESTRRNLLRDVDQAFFKLLAAQASLDIAQDLVRIAWTFHSSIMESVKEGQSSPVEATRARIGLSQQEIQLKRRTAEVRAARKVLAATMGTQEGVGPALGKLDLPDANRSYEELKSEVEKNPDVARWDDEILSLKRQRDVAYAQSVPDITIGGTYRRGQSIGENAYIVEVSAPLPVSDRNRGALRALDKQIQSAREKQILARLEAHRDLEVAVRNQEAAWSEAHILKNEIVPGASQAFDSIREGYRQGMFSLLDVLDAQRTMFSAKARLIDALLSYHMARISIDRLTQDHELNTKSNVEKNSKLPKSFNEPKDLTEGSK